MNGFSWFWHFIRTFYTFFRLYIALWWYESTNGAQINSNPSILCKIILILFKNIHFFSKNRQICSKISNLPRNFSKNNIIFTFLWLFSTFWDQNSWIKCINHFFTSNSLAITRVQSYWLLSGEHSTRNSIVLIDKFLKKDFHWPI